MTGFGEVPQQISFQGYLTDDLGNPVDGNDYVMVFSIYSVLDGGSPMWWEEQTVEVTDGVFNIQIGQDPAGNPFPNDLFDGQRWLGVTVGGDDEMSPRQPLTSVPFAIQAGGTFAGAITENMLADDAVTETKVAAGAITADKIAGGTGSGVDADLVDGMDAASFAPSVHNHDDQYYSKAYINALEERIEALEAKLQYMTVVLGTVNGLPGPHVMITGANFHVRSGSETTDGAINGLGNIIVGYNELRESGSVRTGSHNIVVGKEHNYSSYGGLVAGQYNSISGGYASVGCGYGNTASGTYSSVSGGYLNTANGYASTASGGARNTASGSYSSISGGIRNTASGAGASVSGGEYNIASGERSFVGGGGGENSEDGNEAFAHYSAILGGFQNVAGDRPSGDHAIGTKSTVSGGYYNTASGPQASVSGGRYNTASGPQASVSGGRNNTASSQEATVSGGTWNTASGYYASVSGGSHNTASGYSASVSGGGGPSAENGNEAFANYSAILGGFQNVAGDKPSGDHAIGAKSTVSGGIDNSAIGEYSSVSGGLDNNASGRFASVSGGNFNTASGDYASVSGGFSRSASNQYDWAAGSLLEDY
jgi:hypothetical protein